MNIWVYIWRVGISIGIQSYFWYETILLIFNIYLRHLEFSNQPSGDSPEGRQPEVPEPAKVKPTLFNLSSVLTLFTLFFLFSQVAVEPKPLSLAEEDLLSDLTYDELKRAFRSDFPFVMGGEGVVSKWRHCQICEGPNFFLSRLSENNSTKT